MMEPRPILEAGRPGDLVMIFRVGVEALEAAESKSRTTGKSDMAAQRALPPCPCLGSQGGPDFGRLRADTPDHRRGARRAGEIARYRARQAHRPCDGGGVCNPEAVGHARCARRDTRDPVRVRARGGLMATTLHRYYEARRPFVLVRRKRNRVHIVQPTSLRARCGRKMPRDDWWENERELQLVGYAQSADFCEACLHIGGSAGDRAAAVAEPAPPASRMSPPASRPSVQKRATWPGKAPVRCWVPADQRGSEPRAASGEQPRAGGEEN